ncbi:MAG: protocatechuate 4 5-dioxygenase alpha [Rhodospirillaceae bacterium]|nr:MAG: protocatechuate 4 5-dioxygenase alpha [Rhodospirillaceae bacterium]TNC95356.1 MAG: protocatechuate 4,5-dioxygenase, alpha chain [Stygiobacter sp.]
MSTRPKLNIPGTTLFDGDMARKGYALNKMCFSFNSEENRQAFLADREGYCAKFGLNEEQKQAVLDLNVLAMLAAGGNAYYIAKLGGIYKLDMQDVGAQQTGMSKEAFMAKLVEAGRN